MSVEELNAILDELKKQDSLTLAEMAGSDRRRREMSGGAFANWREDIGRRLSEIRMAIVDVKARLRAAIDERNEARKRENLERTEAERKAAELRRVTKSPEVERMKRARLRQHEAEQTKDTLTTPIFLNTRPEDLPGALIKGARILRARLMLVCAQVAVDALTDYLVKAGCSQSVLDADAAVAENYRPLLEAEKRSNGVES